MDDQLTRVLGRWEGYVVGTVQRFEAGAKGPDPQVWIALHPQPERVKVCDGCGDVAPAVHDVEERWVRDLPILGAQTHLLVRECGNRGEIGPVAAAQKQTTPPPAKEVGLLCCSRAKGQASPGVTRRWDRS